MAAGVNFNNVWAALGKPVSVFNYGDHPEYGHHIGGSDGSGVVWKVGEGVTRWKPGDEVVIHCNQASYEDVEVHGLDPDGGSEPGDLGLRDDLGLVRPVHEGPGPAAAAEAEEPFVGRVLGLRADLLHRLPDAHGPLQAPGWPQRARSGAPRAAWASSRPSCARPRVRTRSAWSPPTRRASSSSSLGAVDYVNRNEFAGMMRTRRRVAGGGEGALQGLPRVRQAGQGDPRRRPRHRLRARRTGDLPDLGLRRQAVRQGRDLRRHIRLHARLRRPLPVDEAEADHRLALRKRV